jgi:hypothetical protein
VRFSISVHVALEDGTEDGRPLGLANQTIVGGENVADALERFTVEIENHGLPCRHRWLQKNLQRALDNQARARGEAIA